MRVCVDPRRDIDIVRTIRGGSHSFLSSFVRLSDSMCVAPSVRNRSLGLRICITPEDTMQVARDPVQQGEDQHRVSRGGGWYSFGQFCRAAYRGRGTPSYRCNILGFRLVLTPSKDHPMITDTDTLAALTLAILESPADPLAWLALADYLEESGEDDRSALVRATLAMRQAVPGTPDHTQHQQTVQILIARGIQPCHPTIELDALPGARFAVIPPGGFLMGTQGRPVVITQPFFLGTTPITQAQWQHVMGRNPARFHDQPDSPHRPVEMVSWNDCQEFCQKLQAALPGWKVSLPTDAQWEYACRAGTQTTYYHGDDETSLPRYAHYNAQSPRAVGELLPNAFGLHDMLGNVWEWCQDGYRSDPLEGQETVEISEEEWKWLRGGGWWSAGEMLWVRDARKSGEPNAASSGGRSLRITLDPTGPTIEPAWGHVRGGSWTRITGGMEGSYSIHGTQTPLTILGLWVCVDPVQQEGSNRVFRGGSWINYGQSCRAADRIRFTPAFRIGDLGFRVTLEGVSA